MSLAKKVLTSLPCRCAYALSAGIAVVSVIAFSLAAISGAEAPASKVTVYTRFHFPDDERTLKEFSAQLQKETEDLSNIAPAAGDSEDPAGDSAAPQAVQTPADQKTAEEAP